MATVDSETAVEGRSSFDATDLGTIIEALRTMSPAEIEARGFRVEGSYDEVDDPVLLGPTGCPSRPGWRGIPTANV